MSSRPSGEPLNPRKRPSQRRAVATVEAILEAAACVLETQGLAGYNTNQIADVAGVSVGSLYQYFPNKDAITGALIRREMEDLLDAIAITAVALPGSERLACLIGVAVDHQLRRPQLARLLDLEEGRLPIDSALENVRLNLSRIVRDCIVSISTDIPQEPQAVEDVIAIIKGIVDSASRRSETDADALRARVERAVFGYLRSVR